MVKYKQSEVKRLEKEATHKQELEAKDKEIESQAKQLSQRQKHDEALLEQHQSELQELREQLSDEKTSARNELVQQMEKLLIEMKNTNNGFIEGSQKDFEKHKRRLNKQLKREWSKLDQCEMKLIEVEAEKRRILQDAEVKLKQERAKSEIERTRCLKEVEKEKEALQEVLEAHLKEREAARKELEGAKHEKTKCNGKIHDNTDKIWKKLTELEWLQYKLSTDQLESGDKTDEISEIMLNIKTVNRDVQILESQHEKYCQKLRASDVRMQKKDEALKLFEAQVQQSFGEIADVRNKLVECQQRFGENLGDVVNIVTLERDADIAKIEKDRELLISKHLEHQNALEVLVSETLQSSDDYDISDMREIKSRVVELVRCASPPLDRESLQSQIVEKKVQIHYQQAEISKNEDERRVLQAHEERFLEQRRETQIQRETEQTVLQDKINTLHEMLQSKGIATKDTVKYYQGESSSLMRAQKHIVDIEKELSDKIRQRRDLETKLGYIKKQMEQQAESNQEQFRGMLERLQDEGNELGQDLDTMRRMLQSATEQYRKRLK